MRYEIKYKPLATTGPATRGMQHAYIVRLDVGGTDKPYLWTTDGKCGSVIPCETNWAHGALVDANTLTLAEKRAKLEKAQWVEVPEDYRAPSNVVRNEHVSSRTTLEGIFPRCNGHIAPFTAKFSPKLLANTIKALGGPEYVTMRIPAFPGAAYELHEMGIENGAFAVCMPSKERNDNLNIKREYDEKTERIATLERELQRLKDLVGENPQDYRALQEKLSKYEYVAPENGTRWQALETD